MNEKKALRHIRSRDPTLRAEAREYLTLAYQPLVLSKAREYQGAGVELEDLEQEARLGLVKSFDTFRENLGAFPTHATWAIRAQLQAATGNCAAPVRLTTKLSFRLTKLRRVQNTFQQEHGRDASADELACLMNLSTDQIEYMLARQEPIRLDEPPAGSRGVRVHSVEDDTEGPPLVERLASPTPNPETQVMERLDLHDALASLPAEQRQVVEAAYGLNGDGEQIVPVDRAGKRLLADGLEKLKRFLS